MIASSNSGSAAELPSELKPGSHIDLAGSSLPVGTRSTILLQAFSFSGQELVFREGALS